MASRDAQRAQLVNRVATLLVNRRKKGKRHPNGRTFNKKTKYAGTPSDMGWGA
jgi:hypothetical protein